MPILQICADDSDSLTPGSHRRGDIATVCADDWVPGACEQLPWRFLLRVPQQLVTDLGDELKAVDADPDGTIRRKRVWRFDIDALPLRAREALATTGFFDASNPREWEACADALEKPRDGTKAPRVKGPSRSRGEVQAALAGPGIDVLLAPRAFEFELAREHQRAIGRANSRLSAAKREAAAEAATRSPALKTQARARAQQSLAAAKAFRDEAATSEAVLRAERRRIGIAELTPGEQRRAEKLAADLGD